MQYDPIKRTLGSLVRRRPILRTAFYRGLGVMFLREWYVKRALREVVPTLGGPKVLDAGMGFGQYSFYLARHFPQLEIYGVDVKGEQVADCAAYAAALGLTNVRFGIADLEQLDMVDRYDFVLSVDVMEHIPDDRTVFRNLCRALKPGGLLLVNTPSDLGGSGLESHEAGKVQGFIEEHARDGYNKDELEAKLREAGFGDVTSRYTYGRAGMIGWRLGIQTPMKLLNRSKAWFAALPFYYAVTLPITLGFMAADYLQPQPKGSGLLVLARKPA